MIALLLAAALAGAAPARAAAPERPLSTEDRRRALLLTDLYLEEQRFPEAEALILERRGSDAEWWDWELRLARLRNVQRRYADAAASYKRLLAERGDDPGLLIQYAHQVLASGDLSAARAAFEKARGLSEDPTIPYELSEIAHAQGRAAESDRWGELALKALEDLDGSGPGRMRLRLMARIRWSDSLENEFGRLYDKYQDPETLSEWAGSLIRRGRLREAAEPLALLRERHPEPQSRWRLLELERLRREGDRRKISAFVEESVAALPSDPTMRLTAGELELSRRRWGPAEEHLRSALASIEHELAADELLVEARRRGHHHAGPLARWRESNNNSFTEAGAQYAGYPRPGWRMESEVSASRYSMRSRKQVFTVPAAALSLAREDGPWTAGADLDVAKTTTGVAASPGVFGGWAGEGLSIRGSLSARRAWRSSADAAYAGARADEALLAGRARLLPRLSVGFDARASRFTVADGSARQTQLTPDASLAVVTSPFYCALSYRVVFLDASGQDAFFAQLPLLRRARTHYASLSAGRSWLRGRVRTDAYVYNGHEPARGRRFGRPDLVGYGGNVEWILPRVVLIAGFDDTLEVFEGVGGRSRSATATALWRWGGPR